MGFGQQRCMWGFFIGSMIVQPYGILCVPVSGDKYLVHSVTSLEEFPGRPRHSFHWCNLQLIVQVVSAESAF